MRERLLSALSARQTQLAMADWECEFPLDRFPLLDPDKKLDWEDKHIYAFGCENEAEAQHWFDRMVEHTVATESGEGLGDDATLTEDDARVVELGRLRLVASNGLGNPMVDTEATMDFAYRMFILPMSERFDIPVDNSDGWGTDKSPLLAHNKIAVPDMSRGVEGAIQTELTAGKRVIAAEKSAMDKLLGKGRSFTDRLRRRR
jgi:hypothetical protein